jgi:ABC-2 type transport system ATP-binding protein
MPAVDVADITKKYGRKPVLLGIGFTADVGEQIAVIGRNGCGKSTLLQILGGILKPDTGSISYFSSQGNLPDFEKYCGYLPQDNPLLEELSVQDNLSLWSGKLGRPEEALIDMFNLSDLLKTPVRKLSGGMKRRVSIACCLVNWPPVMIMDEPTSSLDYVYKREIRSWMREYRSANGIIITATHDDAEIAESSRILLLENGILSEPDSATRTP